MSLGEMIRAKREERDMTQQELAELLHVTRQTISRWESGSRCPDLILSKQIADAFGISLDELVSSSDVDTYVPKPMTSTDIKKMLAALFLVILSVWILVFGVASNSNSLAVVSLILVFASAFLFIIGYFNEP